METIHNWCGPTIPASRPSTWLSEKAVRGQSRGRCIFLLNPFLNSPPQCFSASARASPSLRVEISGEANCFTPGLHPQPAGHPLSPRGRPACPRTALWQCGRILPIQLCGRWARICPMEVISLLFLKSVNQPHNHCLKNIPTMKRPLTMG